MESSTIKNLTLDQLERLRLHQFSDNDIDKVITNNKLLDYYYGHTHFLNEHDLRKFSQSSKDDIKREVDKAKRNSVLEIAIQLTPLCNAHCSICYTNSQKVRDKLQINLLNLSQLKEIVDQSKYLGAKSLFIAGTGEPTLDKRLFTLLNHAKISGLNSYVFTNGITLSNDDEAERFWGTTGTKLAKMFKKSNCFIGPKLWSLKPEKMAKLTGTSGKYRFANINGFDVPKAFIRLEQAGVPPERIVVNMAVTNENFDEVDSIVEFCLQRGYKIFIEEFVQTGRACDKEHLALNQQQQKYLKTISQNDCIKPKIQVVVSHDGYLMECKAIDTLKNHNNCLIKKDGSIKSVFDIRHNLPFLVAIKYRCTGRCYCEIVTQRRRNDPVAHNPKI